MHTFFYDFNRGFWYILSVQTDSIRPTAKNIERAAYRIMRTQSLAFTPKNDENKPVVPLINSLYGHTISQQQVALCFNAFAQPNRFCSHTICTHIIGLQ